MPTRPLGFAGPKTYAAWPVWSNSTTKEIKYQSMSKKDATRLWHRARDFDRGQPLGGIGCAELCRA